MEQSGKGVISSNDLMQKLAQAKKVMNKVNSGNFKTGQVNEEILRSNPEDLDISNLQQYKQPSQVSENINVPDEEITNYGDVSKYNVNKPLNIERVNKSKLPDNIKKAMIEHPISQPDISLSDGIDMKIIQGAKRLMEQDNPSVKKKQVQENRTVPHTQQTQVLSGDLVNTLIPIMENMIRKVMDEKLNQILSAQQTQSINENLVLKVGDSVFKGKITGVNKSS